MWALRGRRCPPDSRASATSPGGDKLDNNNPDHDEGINNPGTNNNNADESSGLLLFVPGLLLLLCLSSLMINTAITITLMSY